LGAVARRRAARGKVSVARSDARLARAWRHRVRTLPGVAVCGVRPCATGPNVGGPSASSVGRAPCRGGALPRRPSRLLVRRGAVATGNDGSPRGAGTRRAARRRRRLCARRRAPSAWRPNPTDVGPRGRRLTVDGRGARGRRCGRRCRPAAPWRCAAASVTPRPCSVILHWRWRRKRSLTDCGSAGAGAARPVVGLAPHSKRRRGGVPKRW